MSNQPSCYLCGNKDLERIAQKLRFDYEADVYNCLSCNLLFLDQASFQYPRDFYEKEYHQTYITHVEPEAFDPEAYYRKMLKSNQVWADRFAEMLTGKELVLDVGCSTGHFIQTIRDRAGQVYGHELNRKEVAFCRDRLHLDVSDQALEERFAPETFDYITMIYVLEHIADPVTFLKHLRQFLKPDGRLIILVPNALDALLNLYEIPTFAQFYFCIEHLYYFNPSTLATVLGQADLSGTVETLQEYPLANHLNWGYRGRPADSLAARSGLPDIQLGANGPAEDWKKLWEELNQVYRKFLSKNGFGDRIWAVVGRTSR